MNSPSDDTAVLSPVPDPGDDGLAAELARAAPRRWWNRGTLVLGAFALLLGGFLGGAQVQKHYGTNGTTATARPGGGAAGARAGGGYGNFGGGTGGFPGGAAPGGAGPGGAAPGGAAPTAAAPTAPTTGAAPTTGKIKLVDGTTVYVETADGTVVTVRTGGRTTVEAATKADLKDLKAGDTVSVQGAAATDGTVTATTVTKSKG